MEAAIQSRARLFGRDDTVPGDGWNGAIRARLKLKQLCRYEIMCLMCTLEESGEEDISRKSGHVKPETSGVQSNRKHRSGRQTVVSRARVWLSDFPKNVVLCCFRGVE